MTRWFDLPRVPEPEVMEDSGEAQAYAGAAAEKYLSQLDDAFVWHATQLLPRSADGSRTRGKALDIGCGPGNITRKLALRLPDWHVIGVDRSPAMIREACERTARSIRLSALVEFLLADGTNLPFTNATFDLVVCNSVLHHLKRPDLLFVEMARVAHPAGAILLRDLRRPSRLVYPWHVRWHGRQYRDLMYKLYCDSVRAAYTVEELRAMLQSSRVPRTRVFTEGRTHLGFARAARSPSA